MTGSTMENIFSGRTGSVIVVVAAIVARAFIQIHFALPDGDKAFQIQAARNFLDGNGLSIYQAYINDLSQQHYTPLVKWPPGYSFFLMPLLLICKSNFFLATLLLDVSTAILFIYYSRRLLQNLNISRVWLNLYTIVSGFFIFEFCTASSSDFLTLTIFIAAFTSLFPIIKAQELKLPGLFVLSFLLFLTGFTRFMFIPIAFVVPAYLILIGYFEKDKLLTKKGFIVFVLLAILMSAFLIIQKSYSGASTYITATERGFYPEYLLRLFPFSFSAIFNTNLVGVQLERITGLHFSEVYDLLIGAHFLFLFVLLFWLSKWISKKKIMKWNLCDHYIAIGALTTISIVLLLAVLSLTNKLTTVDWSFVQEGRYFAFATFFLQQLLFIVLFYFKNSLRNGRKLFVYGCFAILILSTIHGVYFVLKSAGTNFYSPDTKERIELMNYTDSLIKKTLEENPGKNFVIASQNPFLNNEASLKYNIPGVYDLPVQNNISFHAGKETIFILVQSTPVDHVSSYKWNLVGEFKNNYYYTTDVRPDSQ